MTNGGLNIMLKKNTARLVVRRVILAAFVILTAILQNTAGTALARFNAGCFMLLSITVSISIYEKESAGMFFGLLAGALWDLASPAPDGVFALFFTAAGCLCGLLSHYVVRTSLFSAVVLTTATYIPPLLLCVIFRSFIKDPDGVHYYLTVIGPRSLAAALLLLPLSYYPVKLTEKLLR